MTPAAGSDCPGDPPAAAGGAVALTAEELRTTAVHEAGHAVIGRVLRPICGDAAVVADPSDGSAGHAITADAWEMVARWEQLGRWREHDTAVRARIITFMAGAEAEVEFFGACAGGTMTTGGTST